MSRERKVKKEKKGCMEKKEKKERKKERKKENKKKIKERGMARQI
jgi:hypothetical protein